MMEPWLDQDEGVRVIPRPNGGFDYEPLEQDNRMTPTAVHAARQSLGMTQAELARALRLTDPDQNGRRTVRNWEKGATPISGPASVALEALLTGWRPS